MIIPKYPEVPELSDRQIDELTKIVFCKDQQIKAADLLFVFGSTEPGVFLKALEAYQKGIVKEILISGGGSNVNAKHASWTDGSKSEAQSIKDKLMMSKVPDSIIFIEDKSTNSKENILNSMGIYDFGKIKSMYFVSKSHAAGRQYRTLKKYCPIPFKSLPIHMKPRRQAVRLLMKPIG